MRYAVCNELFGAMDFAVSCGIIAEAGFQGIEIAPYTLGQDPSALGTKKISALRRAMEGSGLAFAGMHWLLASPPGLHLASADAPTRRRTIDFLKAMCDLAGGLGGGMLVLGSPRQRGSQHVPAARAMAHLGEALSECGPHAAACGSMILLEALDSTQTDVVNTLSEAASVIASIGSTGVGGMFDFHNTGSETEPWPELIRRYSPIIEHVHANESDGTSPRRGGSDLAPSFAALRDIGFSGWVSVEAFDQPADPASTLKETMSLFRDLE